MQALKPLTEPHDIAEPAPTRPPAVDWQPTDHGTALVRVNVGVRLLAAAGLPAVLTLSSRRRRHRFVELAPDAGADAGIGSTSATFEVPASLLYREGLQARVYGGGVERTLNWSELTRKTPAPEPDPAPCDDPAQAARAERRRVPRSGPSQIAGDAMHARRRAPSPRPSRASVRSRPRPMAHPRATRPIAATPPQPAPCAAPLEVDYSLLEFLPYEHAAPLLALPIELSGDVLTVAVALPSVDLSVVTERCPWLTVKQEVTGYDRIVRALRDVELRERLHGTGPRPDVPGRCGAPDASRATRPTAPATSLGASPGARPTLAHPEPAVAGTSLSEPAAGEDDPALSHAGPAAARARAYLTRPAILVAATAVIAALGCAAASGDARWLPATAVAGFVATMVAYVAHTIVARQRELVAAERRRLARELHDGVAQELAFIVSQASSLARFERPCGPLGNIALAAERALVDARRSILRLTSDHECGLAEAIVEHASQWARRAGLELEVEISDEVEASQDVEHAILRIVQEAISNAVRHSGATKLTVGLSQRDGSITARISDDGRGFDPHGEPQPPGRGFGLVSMAERAEASGGQLRLESEPGRGTVVEVAFG